MKSKVAGKKPRRSRREVYEGDKLREQLANQGKLAKGGPVPMPYLGYDIPWGGDKGRQAQESTLADPVLSLAQVEKLLAAHSPTHPEGVLVTRVEQLLQRVDALQRRINKVEAQAKLISQPVVFELTLQPKRSADDELNEGW